MGLTLSRSSAESPAARSLLSHQLWCDHEHFLSLPLFSACHLLLDGVLEVLFLTAVTSTGNCLRPEPLTCIITIIMSLSRLPLSVSPSLVLFVAVDAVPLVQL